MSQFINIKKFTANALITALVAGSFVSTFDVNEAFSKPDKDKKNNGNNNNTQVDNKNNPSCGNNGHGNNAPMTIALSSGEKLTIGHYDPSNPSNTHKNKLIDDLKNGRFGNAVSSNKFYINFTGSSYSLTNAQVNNIVNNFPDWELKGKKATTIHDCGSDFDGDGISDAIEIGSNVYNPLDTDNDGIPDYADDINNNEIIEEVSLPSDFSCPASNVITLDGTLRDFSDSHPDFQRNPGEDGFKYGLDKNITTKNIGSDRNPVYAGGSFSTTTQDNFNEWYRDVDGVNKKMDFSIDLVKTNSGVYRFEDTSFFPLDGLLMGNEGRSHNYHFTFEIHSQFTYKGGEVLNFSGDDDVWVYIDGKKVIDIGGVHSKEDASVDVDEVADELGLVKGQTYDFDFFFAERRTTQSNFILETNIELLCDTDKDGISNIVEGMGDADGDGIANYKDTDSDGNGILDSEEGTADADGDGTLDFLDEDNDNNGHLDIKDSLDDGDNDGILDYQDTDDDNDGAKDINDNDIDGNGVNNSNENNPNLPSDYVFPQNGKPNDIDGDGILNSIDTDNDGDKVTDKNEMNSFYDLDKDGTDDIQLSTSGGKKTIKYNLSNGNTTLQGGEQLPNGNTSFSTKVSSNATNNDINGDGIPNYLDNNDDGDDLTTQEEWIYNSSHPGFIPSSMTPRHGFIPDIYKD